MFLFKVIILFFLSLNIFADENYVDSLALNKIKKLVQKEEEIALAYKKYLLEKGTIPSTIASLKSADYLPKGFDEKNPFGKQIIIIEDNNSTSTNYKDDKHRIKGFETTDPTLKSNLYDYYYSNKYRINTKAPLSINSSNVEIILSSKEKFIYENQAKITTTKNDAILATTGKYYLDTNGVLHWYQSGSYKFSFDKDLIVDSSVTMLDSNGNKTTEFKNLMVDKDILYTGQTILYKTSTTADEYINIGDNYGILKVNSKVKDIGKTIIQFSRRAGGMIVNGDIYTWGNNRNKITGIDIGVYTGSTGADKYPVITGLVKSRAMTYNSTLDNKSYFSSPLRPKFIDFFSSVFHGTCGISTNNELYCSGVTAANKIMMYTYLNTNNLSNPPEMMYRSKDFDGTTNKATKVFANNALWLILGNTTTDSEGNYKDGKIYRWGRDYTGFAGDGGKSYDNSTTATELVITENNTKVLFKDITYLLTIGYRKMAALSNNGDVYIWGLDEYYNNSCIQTIDLCKPYKIPSNIAFSEIKGGLKAFVAKGTDGKYYKISQAWGELPKVESVNDKIKTDYSSQYVDADDINILSVDFTTSGVVWINSKYELKGNYSSSDNSSDKMFTDSIKKIKWKKIKVIEDNNGMCGIDVNNQMYCWGMQSFYRNDSYDEGNTFMIPVFNTNLYDLTKDFLVAEGGRTGYLTTMTSDNWTTTDINKPFFIKYPTYIGGFNYEFIFK